MFAMYNTPSAILYLILSIGIALLIIFLLIALFNLIGILMDVKKVTNKAKDTVDLVNHYLWQPIKIMLMILEKGKEFSAHAKKKHTEDGK